NTSMGFTPVDGLLMGTRCGEVDPGALLYIADKEGLNANRISNLMNKESGLVGITGISSDMRDITKAASEGNERAKLAIKMFDKRVKKFIGAYAAEMGGVDLVIFTGGIGEHNRPFRKAVLEGMEFMGLEFDEAANEEAYGIDKVISKEGSKVIAMAVTTNEELVIALDTFRLLKNIEE
ncbi:MAG: acetate kinase, partial [Rikenellaceae bacterium]